MAYGLNLRWFHQMHQHPEWVVRHPYQRASIGRNQYVLDFANPEVVDNVFAQMSAVLDQAKIDFMQ